MKSSLIKLHLAVFLWGFTGVLGRLISLNEGLLVWYRMLITIITLFLLMWRQGALQKLPRKTVLQLFGIGGIVALHWVFFYGAIKVSNISITLICLSSSGLITALMEPFIVGSKFSIREVALSLMGIVGIYLIFHFDSKFQKGIIVGMIATFLSVAFSVLNKRLLNNVPSKSIMLYELTGGWLILSLFMPLYLKLFPSMSLFPTSLDWGWLIILSWVCTVLAMDLSLQALRHMSVFTQNLTLNLEPVYGIILAFIVFKENKNLNASFYVGFGLIALSVAFQMIRVLHYKKH